MPITIFIDADACPVTREVLQIAKTHGLPVIIAGNTTQNLGRHIKPEWPREPTEGFWVDILAVPVGADSADFAIVSELEPNDIVVTQDIGLAAMVLGRGAHAIGVRGMPYTLATIDMALLMRHEEKKVRNRGGRTQGPKAFREEDHETFRWSFQRMITDVLRDQASSVSTDLNE